MRFCCGGRAGPATMRVLKNCWPKGVGRDTLWNSPILKFDERVDMMKKTHVAQCGAASHVRLRFSVRKEIVDVKWQRAALSASIGKQLLFWCFGFAKHIVEVAKTIPSTRRHLLWIYNSYRRSCSGFRPGVEWMFFQLQKLRGSRSEHPRVLLRIASMLRMKASPSASLRLQCLEI